MYNLLVQICVQASLGFSYSISDCTNNSFSLCTQTIELVLNIKNKD